MQRQFCVTCHSTIRSTFPARSSEFLVVSSRKCRNVLTRATIFSKHILRQFCWAIAGLLSRKTSKKSAHVFSVTPRFPSIFLGLSSQQPLFFLRMVALLFYTACCVTTLSQHFCLVTIGQGGCSSSSFAQMTPSQLLSPMVS